MSVTSEDRRDHNGVAMNHTVRLYDEEPPYHNDYS